MIDNHSREGIHDLDKEDNYSERPLDDDFKAAVSVQEETRDQPAINGSDCINLILGYAHGNSKNNDHIQTRKLDDDDSADVETI